MRENLDQAYLKRLPVSKSSVMTMETAPVENSEYAEEPVAKKLTSVQTAKPNTQMYFAIAVAMVGAMMFGLDQGNFGNVQTYESFQKHWCEGKFGNGVR